MPTNQVSHVQPSAEILPERKPFVSAIETMAEISLHRVGYVSSMVGILEVNSSKNSFVSSAIMMIETLQGEYTPPVVAATAPYGPRIQVM